MTTITHIETDVPMQVETSASVPHVSLHTHASWAAAAVSAQIVSAGDPVVAATAGRRAVQRHAAALRRLAES